MALLVPYVQNQHKPGIPAPRRCLRPNTIKSYYADLKHFVDWSVVIEVQPFPLSNTTLTRYIESMQYTHRYATIRRKLVAIKKSK